MESTLESTEMPMKKANAPMPSFFFAIVALAAIAICQIKLVAEGYFIHLAAQHDNQYSLFITSIVIVCVLVLLTLLAAAICFPKGLGFRALEIGLAAIGLFLDSQMLLSQSFSHDFTALLLFLFLLHPGRSCLLLSATILYYEELFRVRAYQNGKSSPLDNWGRNILAAGSEKSVLVFRDAFGAAAIVAIMFFGFFGISNAYYDGFKVPEEAAVLSWFFLSFFTIIPSCFALLCAYYQAEIVQTQGRHWKNELMPILILALSLGMLCGSEGAYQRGASDLDYYSTFTSEKWKAASEAQRSKMLDSLIANYPLLGESKADVKNLLGEPTKEYGGTTNPSFPQKGSAFAYRLEQTWDSTHYYRIDFDGNDIVINTAETF